MDIPNKGKTLPVMVCQLQGYFDSKENEKARVVIKTSSDVQVFSSCHQVNKAVK